MKTSAVTPEDIARCVFAVPPLARRPDLSIDAAEQRKLVRHIEAGGITTLLYGGNANLYHMPLREYAGFLAMIEELAAPDTWVIPSAGPDFGRLMDQAPLLRETRFPAVMALPMAYPAMAGGVARGLRMFAEAIGRPLILYLRAEAQMRVEDIGRMVDDGMVCAIKYAIARENPAEDAYLDQLLDRVDRRLVACGLAERPALFHLLQRGLASYTSGGVCITPRLSLQLLRRAQAGDEAGAQACREAFLPLEALRERANVFASMHEAVTLSGIADLGPVLPMLDGLAPSERDELRAIVRDLMAAEERLTR